MSSAYPQSIQPCDYCHRSCCDDIPLDKDGIRRLSDWDTHSMFESEYYALTQTIRGLCVDDADLAILCNDLRKQLHELAKPLKSYGKCYYISDRTKEKNC